MPVIRGTSCCGVQELQGISSHATPQAVVKDICDQMWNLKRRQQMASNYNSVPQVVHGHYIFTGVIRHGKGERPPTQNGGYGPRLAEFIRKHRLGHVVESYEAINRVNNPSHVLKVWVWTPNPRVLRAWYEKHGKRSTGKKRQTVQALPEAPVQER